MAEKETKTTNKTSKPATDKKVAETKKPAEETKSAASKKPAAESKATASKTSAPATKPVTTKATASKTSAPAAKPADAKTDKQSKQNVAAEAVVEKYSKSRGKKTSVIDDVKKERAQSNRQAAANRRAAVAERLRDPQERQKLMLWILVGVLIAALLAGVTLTVVAAVNNPNTLFVNKYASAQAVGFYGEELGTVKRVRPVSQVKNEGLSAYPKYGYTLSEVLGDAPDKVSARNALIREASFLTAKGTANAGGGFYTWMDKDGLLYAGSTAEPSPVMYDNGQQRRLYKHTAAEGLYFGDVADSEEAIVKKVSMLPRGYNGYGVTGVYAPAGEVIKIELSKEDMDATGGLVIHIGQALFNGQANNIWTGKNQMQRIPVLLNTMSVNKNTSVFDEKTNTYTAYVGSFIGGPIYIRNNNAAFTATISGGVRYPHIILGYTTPEEYQRDLKSSAPYFDLEVWSYGVLHSGPKKQAESFSFDDLYKAGVLWEKVALVSTTGASQGIVFLYDPFVAAGAAVAFPGRRSVNCPVGWMAGSLNYKGIVTSGSWGNFHEFHHNFQGYGVGNGGEVTNNAMTLVSYALFTKISSSRNLGNYGASGLGGWNRYTSATWALQQNLSGAPENGKEGLALYATLLHNFGPDNFIQAKVAQRSKGYGQSFAGYMRAWQDVTHYDMTYFFNEVLHGGVSPDLGNSDYPMFVPVSSVYQTGRNVLYNGQSNYVETMQPYVIPYGNEFTIDLRRYSAPNGQYSEGSIVLPQGFSYTVKEVSRPENGGSVTKVSDYVYTYKPGKSLNSGKITVTLGVTKDDGAFEVADVQLVLGFEQTHEKTKTVLDRTIYTYDASKMYTDAEKAYNANFAGYTSVDKVEHSNPTQNSNTDVWLVTDTEAGHKLFPNAKDFQIAKNNTITVIEGKLMFENEGKYRIYLRGRKNCAVYYSLDGGKNYSLGATIKDETIPKNSDKFRPNDDKTYFDVEVGKDSWMYFKEVLIVENATAGGTSFIGLGAQMWQTPMFTMQEKYYDANGKEVSADDPTKDDSKTVTKYYNYLGIEVDASTAASTDPIAPEAAAINKHQPYVSAYRNTYEKLSGEFTSDYFYNRDYYYNYTDNTVESNNQTVVYTDYEEARSWNWKNYNVSNLNDGNKNTYIHTKNGWGASDDKPLTIVADLGEVKTVNRMTMYTQNRPNGDWHYPKDFILEGSIDGNTFSMIGSFENVQRNGTAITVDFDETSLRYYKLTSIGSPSGLVILSEIEMWRTFEISGAQKKNPNDQQFEFYGNWKLQKTLSSFGSVYLGSRNATLKFKFEGTRLGLLCSSEFESNFEVIVDGKVVKCAPQVKPTDEQSGYAVLAYLSEPLKGGEHTAQIKCKGQTAIDSILIYPKELCKVTFVNGSSFYGASLKVDKGATLSEKQIPKGPVSDQGLTFDGWYCGKQKLTPDTVIEGDVTFEAKYIEK